MDAGAPKGGEEEDSTNVELFRQSLIQGWGGGAVGSGDSKSDWAEVIGPDDLRAGDLLLGDPAGFFGEGAAAGPQRIGLGDRIPADAPRQRLLRMLPVVLLSKVGEDGTAEGLWLTMRTGHLMGDFVNHFHSRPLHYGGPENSVLTMVHPYPQVPGSKLLSEETGLYLGGDIVGAQTWVEEGQGSSLRFRFFLNNIRWAKDELRAEVTRSEDRPWIPVRCSADLVLAEVDSIDDKPLWVRVAELAGGEAEAAGRRHNLI